VSDLDEKEQKHVRIALRLLWRRLDGWRNVANVLHCKGDTLEKVANGRRPVSASMMVRVARVAGVSLDELLSGKYAPDGTCPHCGRTPDFIDEQTIIDDVARAPVRR
jgi:hypothetical protein